MKRIIIISGSHGIIGGGQYYIKSISSELNLRGYSCDVYSSDDFFPEGKKIPRIDTWKYKALNFLKLVEIIKRDEPEDVVVILNDISLSMLSPMLRYYGINAVSLIHMSLWNTVSKLSIVRSVYPRIRSFLINVGSNCILNINKENEVLLNKNKTHFVGNFVNAKPSLTLNEKEYDLIFVGRFDKEKQPEIFVELVKSLRDSGLDIKAVMVGGGPLFDQIRELILESHLEKNICLIGYLEKVKIPCFFSKSKYVVITSRTEGFPTVILEAAIHGVDFISYPLGSIPWIKKQYGLGNIAHSKSDLIKITRDCVLNYSGDNLNKMDDFLKDHTLEKTTEKIIKVFNGYFN